MPESLINSTGAVLGILNATEQLGVSGYGGVAFQIQGTFTGTITFEASLGSEWVAMRVTASNSSSPVTTATAPGVYIGSAVGFSAVRARMSSYSDGGAHVLIRADLASPGGAGGGGGSGTDVNLIEVGGVPIALGQTVMASSFPVTMASDQAPIDVNITGGGGSGGTSSDFGDPFPSAGTAIGIADPDGNMHALSAETFDYATDGTTVAQTAIGIALPSTTGPLPVSSTNPLPVTTPSGAKWSAAGASGGTVLTTELNSLANGAYSALGTEINNATGLHRYGWLDVVLASLNPTSGAALTLFMVPAYDGTNYPDAPSATNPGTQFTVQTITVATGSAAKRVGTATFRLPPFKVKFVLVNNTNVALGSSGNTVTLYTADGTF